MTSSGFADGLGRRSLGFDREEGTMLERLTVRPELAAFAELLREPVERLSAMEDERIARPRSIERDMDGSLVVVSEFVPGSRLSDLLDNAAEHGVAPGLDAAFGYLLDVLPALCGLHAGAGFAHGTIAPSRTVLTPAGQVVLLDGIYGGALSLLRYSSRKLWTEFSVAVSPVNGAAPLGVEADIGQVVLSSVMLILGRPLYEDEFPDALPRVIADVIEIAQIRGTTDFAHGFQAFLHRALPLPNRRPYANADDALIDLRELASQLGLDACRRALVDFIEQTEPAASTVAADETDDDLVAAISGFGVIEIVENEDLALVDDLDAEDEDEAEIDLDELVEEPQYASSTDAEAGMAFEPVSTENAILPVPADEDRASSTAATATESTPQHPLPSTMTGPSGSIQANTPATDSRSETAAAAETPVASEPAPLEAQEQPHPASVRSKRAKRTRSARARKDKLRSAATPTPLATQKSSASISKPVTVKTVKVDDVVKPIPEKVENTDKATAAAGTDKADRPEKSEASPIDKRASGNWLVSPGRADAFEPPVAVEPRSIPVVAKPMAPVIAPASVMQPGGAPMPPVVPFAPPAPIAPTPPHIAAVAPPIPVLPAPPRVAVPSFGAPGGWSPPASPATPTLQPGPAHASSPPQVASVKLKNPVPKPRTERHASPADDIYSARAPVIPAGEKKAFPWKMAAGAIAAAVVLIVGSRSYLPAKTSSANESPVAVAAAPPRETREASAPQPRTRSSSAVTSAAATSAAVSTPPSATGRVEVETQPAGAQVLLDGKSVGVSPLTLDAVPAGRHTVTLTSTSGTVKRVVRVEGGRTLKIDVPIFSGWVGIFAPFVIEVSEGGRMIGTTEESRIMLSPGPHVLTLTNRDLGYRAVETVEIEPGEVRSITLDPRGTVNLNASPWAEVWVSGKKAGDTPLAGLQLPLGIQEVTFRHPELGERKVAVTVKGNQPASLSVNMAK